MKSCGTQEQEGHQRTVGRVLGLFWHLALLEVMAFRSNWAYSADLKLIHFTDQCSVRFDLTLSMATSNLVHLSYAYLPISSSQLRV